MSFLRSVKRSIAFSLLSIMIFMLMIFIEPFVIKSINKINVIQLFLFCYISWHVIKMFFLGVFLSPIFLLIAYYIYSPILAYEILLEAKVLNLKLVKSTENINIDWISILTYAYILFGPIVIVIKLVLISPTENLIYFYLVTWDFFMRNASIVFLILLTPFWLREVCRIREFYQKVRLDYPSKLLKLLALTLIGVGSITALVPLFLELLSIFRDLLIATQLFIGAVLLGYLPSLALVIGWLINMKFIPNNLVKKPVIRLESIIEKNLSLSKVKIY